MKKIQIKINGEWRRFWSLRVLSDCETVTEAFLESDVEDIRLVDDECKKSEARKCKTDGMKYLCDESCACKPSTKIDKPDYMEYHLIWDNVGIEEKLELLKDTLEEVIKGDK